MFEGKRIITENTRQRLHIVDHIVILYSEKSDKIKYKCMMIFQEGQI